MRRLRTLLLISATAVAGLVLAASSASAALSVSAEPGSTCSAVVAVGAHGVAGGCHVEFEGEISLYAHVPAETQLFNCLVHLEGFVGGNGSGFVTNQVLTNESPGFPCTRQACDESATAESAHVEHRWPFTISETTPGVAGGEQVNATFCLRDIVNGDPADEGLAGTQCNINFRFLQAAGHTQELGRRDNTHQFCTAPTFVSIKGHLINEPGSSEKVEVTHTL